MERFILKRRLQLHINLSTTFCTFRFSDFNVLSSYIPINYNFGKPANFPKNAWRCLIKKYNIWIHFALEKSSSSYCKILLSYFSHFYTNKSVCLVLMVLDSQSWHILRSFYSRSSQCFNQCSFHVFCYSFSSCAMFLVYSLKMTFYTLVLHISFKLPLTLFLRPVKISKLDVSMQLQVFD